MGNVDPYRLIEQGLQIFPCDPGDKRPVAANPKMHPASARDEQVARMKWSERMSSDPTQIARWIVEYPECKWGLPTGSVNGLVAVDIDSEEASDFWVAKWLPLGKEVTSPSGGRHIYYRVDEGVDIATTRGKIHPDIDTRGEGGYCVAYADDFSDVPDLPASVLEILPERQEYSTEPVPVDIEPPAEVSAPEQRVLKGLTDSLDALVRPWQKGAGYHDTQFRVACALNRVANSPHYATTREDAKRLFLAHAPEHKKGLPAQRWDSAVKATEGQWMEAPGDVPVRLDPEVVLAKHQSSEIDRLYWDSKKISDVRALIRELRMMGATDQEAYSVSYECAAMKHIRKQNPDKSSSTWGFVRAEYDDKVAPAPSSQKSMKLSGGSLLDDAERDAIRNFPNFIDDYIDVAKQMFAEPNLPLHYVNAWVALSCILGAQGAIYLEGGRRPLNLWAASSASSAAGKGDAKAVFRQVVGAGVRGGFGNVYVGQDASAEQMSDILIDRGGEVSLFMQDEASRLLRAMHQDGSHYQRFMDASLDWYDGEASRAIRRGMEKSEVGKIVDTVYNMWIQTTWSNLTDLLTVADVESGFVGRFLFAIGYEAKITDDSLTPKFASEYQIELDGVHPAADALGKSLPSGGKAAPVTTSGAEVTQRYVRARKDVLSLIEGHPMADPLRGIVLRLTENAFKGAALLALSEGRHEIVMTDLLVALKSAGYWIRDVIRVVDAISSSEFRRRVDEVLRLVAQKPKTQAEILRSTFAKNLDTMDVLRAIERAEKEGLIVFRSERWELNQ